MQIRLFLASHRIEYVVFAFFVFGSLQEYFTKKKIAVRRNFKGCK
jgi:hypothetical protein